MLRQNKKISYPSRVIAYTAVGTAAVTVATLIGFSSPQFYFNLGDSVILALSAICGPLVGMLAGGLGSFLADLAVYPLTMFYTLIIKGAEGLICGLLLRIIEYKISVKRQAVLSVICMAFSAYFTSLGYFLCQAFLYGTRASAIVALPPDLAQASASFIIAALALYPLRLLQLKNRLSLNFTKKAISDSEASETDILSSIDDDDRK